jgi:(S)-ureidoglycine aminohydrolase
MKSGPMSSNFYSNLGGLPPQTELLSSKAVFTTAYAVIPRTVMTDIVTSVLPHWSGTRAWVLSRPLTGFSETFSQYVMEVQPGGGSDRPEPEKRAEGVLFVVEGEMTVEFEARCRTPTTPGRPPASRIPAIWPTTCR